MRLEPRCNRCSRSTDWSAEIEVCHSDAQQEWLCRECFEGNPDALDQAIAREAAKG